MKLNTFNYFDVGLLKAGNLSSVVIEETVRRGPGGKLSSVVIEETVR
jgi:hypothetical protein